MKEIGIGLIGTGQMGKTQTFAYRSLPLFYQDLHFRTRLIGVSSGHLANAERFRDELGFEFATADFREILERPDIDAVSICTPNNLHSPMILAAIAAGKHIYCDKPMVTSLTEAQTVLAALMARDGQPLVHQLAMNYRFFPATMRARQLIEEGRIGKIQCFRAAYLHSGSVDFSRPIGWRLDKTISGGGVLFDLGSHVLDLLYSLMGDYRRILARTRIAAPKRPDLQGRMVDILTEDSILMIAEMKNGSQGTIEATKIATGANDELRFEIHGDGGTLRFNLMEPDWLDFYDNTLPEQPLGGNRGFTRIDCGGRYEKPGGGFPSPRASIGWLRSHVHCLYSFLDCIEQQRQASPSFQDGAYIQKIMDLAYESDRTGRWIDCC